MTASLSSSMVSSASSSASPTAATTTSVCSADSRIAIDLSPPHSAATTIRANVISAQSAGIRISSGSGVTIAANLFLTSGIPIDLGGDGPTPNDAPPVRQRLLSSNVR